MATGIKRVGIGAAIVLSYQQLFNSAGANESIIGKAKALKDRHTVTVGFFGMFNSHTTHVRSACPTSFKGDNFRHPSNVRSACKIGSKWYVLGDPARSVCEANLPIDSRFPIKFTVGELKKLIEEGRIKHIGLSEAMPFTIRGAYAVNPITAAEVDWSLWARDAEKQEIPASREELGIGGVVINPYGKRFCTLGPRLLESLADNYFPKTHPRFQEENLENTKNMYGRVNEMATMEGCMPLQLALDYVGSIPGTIRVENFNQNIAALSVKLTPEKVAELETNASADAAKRGRYGASSIKIVGSLQIRLH